MPRQPSSTNNEGQRPESIQVDLANTVRIDHAGSVNLNQTNAPNAPDGTPDRPITVRLSRASENPLFRTEVALWDIIEHSTKRLSFKSYQRFMDEVLQPGFGRPLGAAPHEPLLKRDAAYPRPYNVYGSDAYDLVREASKMFLMQEAGRVGDVEWLLYEAEQVDPAIVEKTRLAYIDMVTEIIQHAYHPLPVTDSAKARGTADQIRIRAGDQPDRVWDTTCTARLARDD